MFLMNLHSIISLLPYSVASAIPAAEMANWQSASGREGESKTCMILFSPRPLRSRNLVVEA